MTDWEAVSAKSDIEPLALWGAYDKEDYLSRFARELGVAQCQVVRLRPTAVCLAGVDSGKLRAALRNIDASSRVPAARIVAKPALAPTPAPLKPEVVPPVCASGGGSGGGIDDLFAKRLEGLRIKRESAQLEARAAQNATTAGCGDDEEDFDGEFESEGGVRCVITRVY